MTRRTNTTPAAAADAGFPVQVRMPHGDGPLIVHDVRAGTRQEYAVEGGLASASTRARLDQLVALGGQPVVEATTDTPPAGAGPESPDEGGASA